jgi:hypothetical protein
MHLSPAPAAAAGPDEGWQRERLFSGLAELLWAAARVVGARGGDQ